MAVTTPPERRIDGDSNFLRGMNSQLTPQSLVAGFYRQAMNMLNRGGVLQTRPGYDFRFTMPEGNLQGACLFRPTSGFEYLVFAVNGLIYASQYPFKEYAQVPDISFRDDVLDIYFCVAEKGSQVQPDETVKLITPFRLVVIQDGYSPPAIWDGSAAQTLTNSDDTPIGTAMAWSGNRLWVARDQEIFSSDIYDPTSFREGTYLSNAKSFLVDRPVTALAEVTINTNAQLIAFTETTAWAFKSNIRKRSTWEDVEQFQSLLLPEIGCIAHRSVVTLNGLLWWYSASGVTNLDAATSTYLTSEFKSKDSEMAVSKGLLGPWQSTIAAAPFENYLLVSVPHADQFNAHTWVLDKSPGDTLNEESADAWNCYWTGTRPVAWAYGKVLGDSRIFQFSKDYDGNNRCWEAFSSERTDAGAPIVWALETRGYNDKNILLKAFRWAELQVIELSGVIDMAVFWSGISRGAYKRCMTKRILASIGVIDDEFEFDADPEDGASLFSLKKQSRQLLTVDTKQSPTDKTSCNVESDKPEWEDLAFQLLVVGSGQAAISSIRMFMDERPEQATGRCEKDETDENDVRFDGTGAESISALETGPEIFSSEKTVTASYGELIYDSVASATSIVSQKDADKQAQAKAQSQADYWYSTQVPYIYGDPSSV